MFLLKIIDGTSQAQAMLEALQTALAEHSWTLVKRLRQTEKQLMTVTPTPLRAPHLSQVPAKHLRKALHKGHATFPLDDRSARSA